MIDKSKSLVYRLMTSLSSIIKFIKFFKNINECVIDKYVKYLSQTYHYKTYLKYIS